MMALLYTFSLLSALICIQGLAIDFYPPSSPSRPLFQLRVRMHLNAWCIRDEAAAPEHLLSDGVMWAPGRPGLVVSRYLILAGYVKGMRCGIFSCTVMWFFACNMLGARTSHTWHLMGAFSLKEHFQPGWFKHLSTLSSYFGQGNDIDGKWILEVGRACQYWSCSSQGRSRSAELVDVFSKNSTLKLLFSQADFWKHSDKQGNMH